MSVSTEKMYSTALKYNGNLQAAANALGIKSRSTVWSRLKKAGLLEELRRQTSGEQTGYIHQVSKDAPQEKLEIRPKGDSTEVHYLGSKIETAEQLLEHAEIDLDLYEIDRIIVNNWEVAGNGEDTVWKTGLRQIKVYLRRKSKSTLVLESIARRLESSSPKVRKIQPKKTDDNKRRALEVSLMDIHYGMLCHASPYDKPWSLDAAEETCWWAIDKIIDTTAAFGPFEEIVFPFGNDFLHHDNVEHSTTRGTPQPDGMNFMHVYERAILIAIEFVLRLSEIAPVKIIQVSGNHDYVSTFTLGHILRAHFYNNENVSIDVSPSPYKFYRFGTNLIGFDHGHHVHPIRLAALMANECRDVWGETAYREWHLGDKHRKATSKPSTFEEQGVSIDYLPSLVPPNAWHRLKGFNWQKRGAVGFVWDYDEGLVCRVPVTLNSYTGKPLGQSV